MAKKPKVSPADREKQTAVLYEHVGRIVVDVEHLNQAMYIACLFILTSHGLPQPYASTVLAGMNLEPMRRMWTALMKQHMEGDKKALEMIDHVSGRIDKANSARNQIVHKVWYIGWGNDETETYEIAAGSRAVRDMKKGGTRILNRDTKHFGEVLQEIQTLSDIALRMHACALMTGKPAFSFAHNFRYDDGRLIRASQEELLDAVKEVDEGR